MNRNWLASFSPAAALVALLLTAVSADAASWVAHGPEGGSVSVLAVDPAHLGTVYAVEEGGGIYKTANSGAAWALVNTGLTSIDIRALASDGAERSTPAATPAASSRRRTAGRAGRR